MTASIDLTPPVAAFGGGKYRTPVAAGLSGKRQARTHEAFTEVREAFRRVAEVHQGARKSSMQTRQTSEMETLAQKLSRNRKLGSKQFLADEAHAAELYHQRRRIASSGSLTERRKNKLDPSIYPVMQMRNSRFATAADLLDQEYARRAGYPPMQRPQSARAATSEAAQQQAQPAAAQTAGEAAAGGNAGLTAAAVPPSSATAAASSARPASASARVSARKPAVSARGAGRPASARGGATGSKGAAAPASDAAAAAFGDLSLGKPTRDVAALRRRLLEQIVDRRLFREAELRPFLQAVVRANKQIEAALLKEAVRDVEREFYLLN